MSEYLWETTRYKDWMQLQELKRQTIKLCIMVTLAGATALYLILK